MGYIINCVESRVWGLGSGVYAPSHVELYIKPHEIIFPRSSTYLTVITIVIILLLKITII